MSSSRATSILLNRFFFLSFSFLGLTLICSGVIEQNEKEPTKNP
jgi:hypothetical protein